MTNDANGTLNYLEEILRMTEAGDIQWSKPSTSMFLWQKSSSKGQFVTSLQRVRNPKARSRSRHLGEVVEEYQYHFLLRQTEGGMTDNLTITTADIPECYEKLDLIYNAADKALKYRGTDLLKNLLAD